MNILSLPTVTRLSELLFYEPETGAFLWVESRGSKYQQGTIAGGISPAGYRRIMIDGVKYRASRLAFKIMTGRDPVNLVDHINGCRSDDRWANLREATYSENCMNAAQRKDNRCGLKGVFFHKKSGRFVARIAVNGKQSHLGEFGTPEAAHAAYVAAAYRLHGAYARVL